MLTDRNGFEILAPEVCFELLATEWFGRVGVTIDGLPAILPISYALDDGSIVFRTVRGSKLEAIGRGEVVCFQVDHADRDRREGWSVLVIGRATEVVTDGERAALDELAIDAWPSLGADRYVRLPAELVTGRRIGDDHPRGPG